MAEPANPKKRYFLTAEVTAEEHAAAHAKADGNGTDVSNWIRDSFFEKPRPRARPQPTINRKAVSQLIGKLGELSYGLRMAADPSDQGAITAQIEAAHRDIAAMCSACFDALGRGR